MGFTHKPLHLEEKQLQFTPRRRALPLQLRLLEQDKREHAQCTAKSSVGEGLQVSEMRNAEFGAILMTPFC